VCCFGHRSKKQSVAEVALRWQRASGTSRVYDIGHRRSFRTRVNVFLTLFIAVLVLDSGSSFKPHGLYRLRPCSASSKALFWPFSLFLTFSKLHGCIWALCALPLPSSGARIERNTTRPCSESRQFWFILPYGNLVSSSWALVPHFSFKCRPLRYSWRRCSRKRGSCRRGM